MYVILPQRCGMKNMVFLGGVLIVIGKKYEYCLHFLVANILRLHAENEACNLERAREKLATNLHYNLVDKEMEEYRIRSNLILRSCQYSHFKLNFGSTIIQSSINGLLRFCFVLSLMIH